MAEQAGKTVITSEPSRSAPALSATSDQPDFRTALEAAAKNDPDPKSEVKEPSDTAATDDAGEGKEGEAEGGEPKETKASAKEDLHPAVKAEITRLRNQRRDEKAAREASDLKVKSLEDQLGKALQTLERVTGESAVHAKKSADKENPKPDRAKFDNPEAYEAAIIEWAGETAARVAIANKEASDKAAHDKEEGEKTASERKAAFDAIRNDYAKRVEDFTKDHPDFDEVFADDLPISTAMGAYIMEDENGPDIAYYLGQNRDEAERIAKLSPQRIGTELGRIAAKLTAKPIHQPKPKPLNPLKGANAEAGRKDPSSESMEDYAARRQQELYPNRFRAQTH